ALGGLALFGRLPFLGIARGFGLGLLGDDRLDLFLDRRRGARAARLEEGLGIEFGAAFRALDLAEDAAEIVIPRAAARTDPLRSPFRLGHCSLRLSKAPGRPARGGSCHAQGRLSKAKARAGARCCCRGAAIPLETGCAAPPAALTR